jgi:DNA-binding winged helix-turn-helix (wHTH) protein
MKNLIKIGEWQFDSKTHQLIRGEICRKLENRQAQVLLYLVQNHERDISKDELLALWRPRVVNEDALYVCIANLRKALGDEPRSPRFIKTLPGFGYRFLAPVTPHSDPGLRRNRKFILPATAFGAVALITLLAVLFLPPSGPAVTEPPKRIADDYHRARYLLSQGTEHHAAAMELLREIMAREPSFPDAYALAAYHQGLIFNSRAPENEPAIQQSLTWIEQALTLNPQQSLAHLAKANLLFYVEWDFEGARQHYQRALGPAVAHFHYAQFLLAMREFPQALEHSYLYQQKDPTGYSRASVAWIQSMTGAYEQALGSINKLHEIDPSNSYYHVCRQAIFEQLLRDDTAFAELHWLMQNKGYTPQEIQTVKDRFSDGGLTAAYAWLLDEDTKRLNLGQYDAPLSLARYAISAGQHDRALALLQQAVDQRQVEVLWLAADPKYQPLYRHPAFHTLLRQIGLQVALPASK